MDIRIHHHYETRTKQYTQYLWHIEATITLHSLHRSIMNWGIWQWGWSPDGGQKHPELRYLAVRMERRWRAEASWTKVFGSENGAQIEGRSILNWGIWQWGWSPDGGQKHPELRYLAVRMEPRWRAEASWTDVFGSEDGTQQWEQKHSELRYLAVRIEPSSEGRSILNWGIWQWGWSPA